LINLPPLLEALAKQIKLMGAYAQLHDYLWKRRVKARLPILPAAYHYESSSPPNDSADGEFLLD
jgi:hypothetical protein